MLSDAKTIIQDGKLLGYIRLQTDVLDKLGPETLMILEREFNKGDSTIITFRLKLVASGYHKGMGI